MEDDHSRQRAMTRLLAAASRYERLVSRPAVILLAAVAIRAAIVVLLRLHQEPFRAELQRTAESLVATGVYGNEYLIPTGPTAHVSPAHTLLVAAAFRLFGIGVGGEIAVYAVSDDQDPASGDRCAAPADDSFLFAPIGA